MAKNSKKATPAPAPAPVVTGPRGGRLAATVAALSAAYTGKAPFGVKAAAAALTVPERDIRLAIDAMRRKGGYDAVTRTAPGTFAIPAAKAK